MKNIQSLEMQQTNKWVQLFRMGNKEELPGAYTDSKIF